MADDADEKAKRDAAKGLLKEAFSEWHAEEKERQRQEQEKNDQDKKSNGGLFGALFG